MPAVYSEPLSIQVAGTLRNDGTSTVYYRDEYPVSATLNDGSLGQGQSATLSGVQWIACAAGQRSNVTVIPDAASSSGSGISRTVSSITYAASITPALPTSGDAVYNVGTLTGNLSVVTPSGTPADGQLIKFRFVQDATGRTLTFDSGYSFGTDVQLAMFPTAASAKFEAAFEYDSTSSKWRCIGVIRGF